MEAINGFGSSETGSCEAETKHGLSVRLEPQSHLPTQLLISALIKLKMFHEIVFTNK